MGQDTKTPIVGVNEPYFVGFEDEPDLRELVQEASDRRFGPIRCYGDSGEVERALVEALIAGHRRFVLLSDVQVKPEMGGDKGRSISDGLCARALSGELFCGADVTVEVVRMTGNDGMQRELKDRSGVRLLPKPFLVADLNRALGEAEQSVLTGALHSFEGN